MPESKKANKKKELAIRSSAAEHLTFVAATGESDTSFEIHYEDENIWLTQRMMATLYNVDVRTISEHIKKVCNDSELVPEATIRKFRIVQTKGFFQVKRRFNLQIENLSTLSTAYNQENRVDRFFNVERNGGGAG